MVVQYCTLILFGNLRSINRDAVRLRLYDNVDITYLIRTISRLNTTAIEEESDRVGRLALSVAKRIHEFLQMG